MGKKSSSISFLFKRLTKKSNSGGRAWRSKSKSSTGIRWKKKFNLRHWIVDPIFFKFVSKSSTGFPWKKKFNLRHWIVDTIFFKIVSILEAVFLVSRLCFFFLCCGFRF